ncbi:tail fiber domain-containing protein [Aureibaculum sp. A20]|uniref:Tail fiber domain-containing protein n=1 Tax=Aureibaculum flavum TaxID=2795986 RepID=A0ABS0WML5_9FLAO|nr:tail fiber domain-containing protein [Aureibaculum flavum]MBJ2173212.1 tail fiber domain-containing protein [Aureibaculum flavum]
MNKNLQILTLFLTLVISTTLFSQTEQSNFINYQGVANNTSGEVMVNETITVGIALKYGLSVAASYAENHTITTDANGVFSLKIGNGSATASTYEDYQWGNGVATFLTVSINGTEIGTTELLAVPYAISAGNVQWDKNGEDIRNINIGNVEIKNDLEIGGNIKLEEGNAVNEISTDGTMGDNSDEAIPTEKAVKTYVDINTSSGLEAINEGNGIGWRLKGQNSNDYGNIGNDAVDLSWGRNSGDNSRGATGFVSFAAGNGTRATISGSTAFGFATTASGPTSTAFGGNTLASGSYSTTMGHFTLASGSYSTAIGTLNLDNVEALFMIGNGENSSNRHNALTVLKNGKVGIGNHQPSSLLEVAHKNGPPTSSNLTNALSIRNLGDNEGSSSDDESWQIYTEDNGYLLLFNSGEFRGAFNATTGAYGQVSDRRKKRDITPLEANTLEKVMKLNPVSYLMKSQKDTKRNLGLISQEVKEIFPTLTHYLEDQDILELSYTELIPILIKALQEQQEIIDGQNSKIDNLSADVSAIKTLLENRTVKREVAEK